MLVEGEEESIQTDNLAVFFILFPTFIISGQEMETVPDLLSESDFGVRFSSQEQQEIQFAFSRTFSD